MRKTHLILILSFLVLCITACSDQLKEIGPKDKIPQDKLTPEDISRLMNGVYSQMENYIFGIWFEFDTKGENLKGGPGGSLVDPLNMTPSSASPWQSSFTSLSQVNFLIESYEKQSGNEAIKAMGGAAYYFRALIYYNMVIRWGGMPILRKRTTDIIPRSTEEETWAFIEEDLEKALSLLPPFSDKFYVSLPTGQALAARVALARNKPEAVQYADALIGNTSFSLASTSEEYATPFVANTSSKEVIFALANKRSASYLTYTGKVNDVDPTWDYAPSNWTYANLFEDDVTSGRAGDLRKKATFSTDANRIIKFPNGVDGQQLVPTTNQANTPIVVSRIAEMYLIKAEVLGAQNGAQTLLTFLEKRYSAVPTLAYIQSLTPRDYQNLILNERRREFYAEGYRWYDLKRTNRLDLFETLNDRDYLMYYPIPQREIDLVGEAVYPQNQGYSGAK